MASSHTLSPTFHGVKFQVDCSLMIHWAVSWAAITSFLAPSRAVMQFSRVGRNIFPAGGYALGSLLQSSLEDAGTPVFFLELLIIP